MKKGKWLLTTGACTLMAAALTACGPGEEDPSASNEEGSSGSNTLLVWEDIQKSEGITEAVEQFEQEHDVQIEVIEKGYAGQIEDLRLDGPSGSGPDVITVPHDQIGTAVTEGLLAELDVSDDVTSLYTEETMLSQMVDGKVYGLPKAVETTVLFYNKELVDENNLPETLEEWYDLSVDQTKDGQYGFLAKWDEVYYAQSVLGGYGGYVFPQDADGNYDVTDIGLNNEGAVEGGEYIQTFFKEGLFPAGIIGEQGINVLDSLFTEQKAAAVISGPWSFGPYAEAGVDYGVAPLPLLSNGENMSSFLGVKSYNVSSYSDNAELAQEFVEFLTNFENSKKRFEITQEVPPLVDLIDDPVVTENENAAAMAEQSLNASLTPNIPEMAEVWTPVDNALGLIATDRAEVQQALDEAVQTIDSQIQANHSR
ncbi:extracellular solute-binding protein [Alkalicoccobacillus porphyridii]|uniref:Maltodextrin-binding protein n=1 Tax=Alkalicoccobacillus porphyridii TaxID=2597270 RepID=A0A554A453_9BACI|nr:extracellular solute-binding protein [Alkalicoccobacillus porphyridii]TSB48473.1 extracellular solute-binding protein [Alkalicoccobacillus porphyridii]